MDEEKRQSQNAWVLGKLKAGAMLSSRNAVIEYGIQDLPKRISELRRQGNNIESVRVTGENRTHWNLYWLGA